MQDGPFWGEIRSCEDFQQIAVMPELDDRTADFNLIAAAPDLLEALSQLLSCSAYAQYGNCHQCTTRANAAIKKANTGE